MKKIIGVLIIISLAIIGIGIYLFTNDNNNINIEKSIVSNIEKIEESNKKYLETKENEDEEWKLILETMEIEEDETWNILMDTDLGEDTTIAEQIKNMPIVGVGDSVFLSAMDELKKVFPNSNFDGKVSRALSGGLPILRELKNQGKLSNTIILGLSTNGFFDEKKCLELMSIVEERNVFWISSVGADDPTFNRKFALFAKNYPNIRIVRWDRKASNHPEYFYKDGIHIKGQGINAYVEVVYETIYKDSLKLNINSKQEMLTTHQEEISERTAFYGNDLLINTYPRLNKEFTKAIYNIKRDYTFEELYNDLKEKVDNNDLEYKLVLVFDKNSNITESDYEKIIELCKLIKTSLCVTFHLSGKEPTFSPAFCSSVPVAPSRITILFFKYSLKSILPSILTICFVTGQTVLIFSAISIDSSYCCNGFRWRHE